MTHALPLVVTPGTARKSIPRGRHGADIGVAVLALLGCGCMSPAAERPAAAGAYIESRTGDDMRGIATFTGTPHGLHIVLNLVSAPPGLHSVHINDAFDCDSVAGGGHFNPDRNAHGAFGATASHAGDLGNIEIAANGTGVLDVLADRLTLGNDAFSIFGRTIVIDQRRDDPLAQPWGDSGAPLACGVVRRHLE